MNHITNHGLLILFGNSGTLIYNITVLKTKRGGILLIYILSIIAYLVLALIVLVLFLLSIVSSVLSGHYVISVLKLAITFFLIYELQRTWLSNIVRRKDILKGLALKSDDIHIFLSVLIGSIFTYFLNHDLALGAVTASCLIGLFGALMLKKYQVPLYCGSFAGMVSYNIVSSYPGIIIVGVFAGLLYVISREVFNGFGGKLGAMAFFGTAVSSVILGTISKTMVLPEISLNYWLILYFVIGAGTTFLMKEKLKFSAVLASAIAGLAGALLLPLLHGDQGTVLAVGLFCGTFVGMSSVDRLFNFRCILLAGLLGAIVFSYTQPYFTGLGGKLGAIAFGSGIAAAGIYNFTERFRNGKKQL